VTRLDGFPRGLLPFDNQPTDAWWERSGYFAERNLGKKGITLDMATPKGREILVSLLDHFDVIATNFTPRVMAGWGLGPDKLLAMKPGLVVLSMSGFGGAGPDSEKPALAGLIEASSGFTSMVRYADDEPPSDIGFSFGDMVSGLYAALSTLIALDRRDRTGKGDAIDLSCSEAPLPYLAVQLHEWARTGKPPSVEREIVSGGRHVLIRTEGDDTPERWVLAFVRPAQEAAFTELAGEGQGPLTVRGRQEDLVADLRGRGVVASPLANAEELIFSPELKARRLFEVVNRPTVGPLPHSRAVPVLCNGAPIGRRRLDPPPRLGEHSRQIFTELLGMSEDQYRALEEELITGETPTGNLPSALRRPVRLDELERRGRVRSAPDAAARLAGTFGYTLPSEAVTQQEQEKTQ
jgi:succinyl-CoA--D-citramalate CoA-transferase